MKSLYHINQDKDVEEVSKQIAEDRRKQNQADIELIKAHPLFFVAHKDYLKKIEKPRKGNIYIVAASTASKTEFHIVNDDNEPVKIENATLWEKYKGKLSSINIQRDSLELAFIKDALDVYKRNTKNNYSNIFSSNNTQSNEKSSSQETELSPFQLKMIEPIEKNEYYLAVATDNNNHDFYRVGKDKQKIKILTIPTSLLDIENHSEKTANDTDSKPFKIMEVENDFLNNLQKDYTYKYSKSLQGVFKKGRCGPVLAIAEQLNEQLELSQLHIIPYDINNNTNWLETIKNINTIGNDIRYHYIVQKTSENQCQIVYYDIKEKKVFSYHKKVSYEEITKLTNNVVLPKKDLQILEHNLDNNNNDNKKNKTICALLKKFIYNPGDINDKLRELVKNIDATALRHLVINFIAISWRTRNLKRFEEELPQIFQKYEDLTNNLNANKKISPEEYGLLHDLSGLHSVLSKYESTFKDDPALKDLHEATKKAHSIIKALKEIFKKDNNEKIGVIRVEKYKKQQQFLGELLSPIRKFFGYLSRKLTTSISHIGFWGRNEKGKTIRDLFEKSYREQKAGLNHHVTSHTYQIDFEKIANADLAEKIKKINAEINLKEQAKQLYGQIEQQTYNQNKYRNNNHSLINAGDANSFKRHWKIVTRWFRGGNQRKTAPVNAKEVIHHRFFSGDKFQTNTDVIRIVRIDKDTKDYEKNGKLIIPAIYNNKKSGKILLQMNDSFIFIDRKNNIGPLVSNDQNDRQTLLHCTEPNKKPINIMQYDINNQNLFGLIFSDNEHALPAPSKKESTSMMCSEFAGMSLIANMQELNKRLIDKIISDNSNNQEALKELLILKNGEYAQLINPPIDEKEKLKFLTPERLMQVLKEKNIVTKVEKSEELKKFLALESKKDFLFFKSKENMPNPLKQEVPCNKDEVKATSLEPYCSWKL